MQVQPRKAFHLRGPNQCSVTHFCLSCCDMKSYLFLGGKTTSPLIKVRAEGRSALRFKILQVYVVIRFNIYAPTTYNSTAGF